MSILWDSLAHKTLKLNYFLVLQVLKVWGFFKLLLLVFMFLGLIAFVLFNISEIILIRNTVFVVS